MKITRFFSWLRNPLVIPIIGFLLVLGVVMFALIRPFVWFVLVDLYPELIKVLGSGGSLPSDDLGVTLTITIGLLALGVAAFGYGSFLLLRTQIIEEAHNEGFDNALWAQAESFDHISWVVWRIYHLQDELPTEAPTRAYPIKIRLIESALETVQKAKSHIKRARDSEDRTAFLRRTTNNAGYYLAELVLLKKVLDKEVDRDEREELRSSLRDLEKYAKDVRGEERDEIEETVVRIRLALN